MYYIKDIQAHKIVVLFERDLGISPDREYVPIYFDAMVPNVVFHPLHSCIEILLYHI